MDVLLPLILVVGAIFLIGITVVMVWPERGARAVGESPADAEVRSAATMHETSIPPQGDRFEDQYTNATADLSAGGVAAALQQPEPAASAAMATPSQARSAELRGIPTQDAVEPNRGGAWPEADARGEHIGLASRSDAFPRAIQTRASEPRGLARQPSMMLSVGSAALLTLGGAVGGAFLYARWQQRQRNKPINRLRRAQASTTVILWRVITRARDARRR